MARVCYCFHTAPYRSLQQKSIKTFCFVFFSFGKLQRKTYNDRIPNISIERLENELDYQSAHKAVANTNVSAQCITLPLIL